MAKGQEGLVIQRSDEFAGSHFRGARSLTAESPQVSFVVPARNEERIIAGSISSLQRQVGIGAAEIIVVDNGSTDATAEVAAEMGVRVVYESQPGLASARQAGLNAARGEILIYVDADSQLPRDWTADIVRLFARDPGLAAVSTDFTFHDGRLVDTLGCFLFCSLLNPVANCLLRLTGRPGVLIGSAIALRTDALRRVGGIDVRFPFYGEDTSLAYQLHRAGKVRFVRSPSYQTSARRYQRLGIARVVTRYFTVFGLLHLGRTDAAQALGNWFQHCDSRDALQSEAVPIGVGQGEPQPMMAAAAD
jgi:glycosyltransferase involved in cell wall biosynthesis